MERNKKVQGFTLIELVLVIVILGILSAFALPRFADLSSEARISTLEGLEGAIKGAVTAQHSIALFNQNNESLPHKGLENGFIANGVLFDQGYPVAIDFDVPFGSFNVDNDPDDIPEILEAVDLDADSWIHAERIGGSQDGQVTRVLFITLDTLVAAGADDNAIEATNCYVSYDSFVAVSRRPVITTVTSGC